MSFHSRVSQNGTWAPVLHPDFMSMDRTKGSECGFLPQGFFGPNVFSVENKTAYDLKEKQSTKQIKRGWYHAGTLSPESSLLFGTRDN